MPLLWFYFGACVGSFIFCLSERTRLHESLWITRSYCPHCRHTLSYFDLFPILSYCLNKGQCRHCHTLIGMRYWVIEVICGTLFLLLYYCHNEWVGFVSSPLTLLMAYCIVLTLLLLSIVDCHALSVPSYLLLVLAFECLLLHHLLTLPYWTIIYGGIIGGLLFLISCLRPNSLGSGDISLYTILIIVLPILWVPWFILLSACFGSVTYCITLCLQSKHLPRFPFIPAISMSFIIVFAWYLYHFF